MKRAFALVGCLFISACGGNWSNRDLEFLNALPVTEELTSKLPQDTRSQGGLRSEEGSQRRDGLALGDTSQLYLDTKKSSDEFNKLLEGVLGLVELVRGIPPTTRREELRIWGPFPDRQNPGYEIQILMERMDEQNFTFHVEMKKQTVAEWTALITANLKAGAELRRGQGHIELSPKAAREIGLIDPSTLSLDTLEIDYITDLFPKRVEMQFRFSLGNLQDLSAIGYTYRELEDTSGSIRFQVTGTTAQINTMEVTSRWLPSGAGRADTLVTQGLYAGAGQVECWDSAFKVSYAKQGWPGGLTLGTNESECVTVPGL